MFHSGIAVSLEKRVINRPDGNRNLLYFLRLKRAMDGFFCTPRVFRSNCTAPAMPRD